MNKFRQFFCLAIGGLVLFGANAPAGAQSANQRYWNSVYHGPVSTVARASSGCPSTACNQVLRQVSRATAIQQVPANLTPSLVNAANEGAVPDGLNQCALNKSQTASPSCIIGPADSTKKMVLFGDSHALMWSFAFASIAARTGYSVLLLMESGCVFPNLPAGGISFESAVVYTSQCAQWKANSLARINQFQPSIVVLSAYPQWEVTSSGKNASQSQLTKSWVPLLHSLAAPGRRVVVLGDIPYLAQDPPDCLAAHEGAAQNCSTPPEQAVQWPDDLAQWKAATESGDSYVNVTPWFCNSNECPAVIGNFDVYSNQYHVTQEYADHLSVVLQRALGLPVAAAAQPT